MSGEYKREYEESICHPEKFWRKAAKEIHWYKPFEKVFDDSCNLFIDGFQEAN